MKYSHDQQAIENSRGGHYKRGMFNCFKAKVIKQWDHSQAVNNSINNRRKQSNNARRVEGVQNAVSDTSLVSFSAFI